MTFSSLSSTSSGVLARREAGAVGDPEDVGVDREGLLAERGVEHDVGGLAADPGQRLELVASRAAPRRRDRRSAPRDSAMTFFALVLNRPIVLMCSLQRLLAERDHLLRAS